MGNPQPSSPQILFFGLSVLAVIIVSHGNEVAEILSGMHVNALIIPHTLYAYGAAVLMLIWGLYEKSMLFSGVFVCS